MIFSTGSLIDSIIEVDGTVWKKLNEDEKKRIEEICNIKLEKYYSR